MKRVIIMIVCCCTMAAVFGQSMDAVLQDIERNNTTLKALRASMDARKLEVRKDIQLDDPEVEFGYLWGQPSSMGNRVDLDVTQQFDFPTTYFYKSKIAEQEGRKADLGYATARRQLMTEARLLCVQLIYFNVMREEFNHHIEVAQEILDAYQKMFDAGEKGILDLNKAKLNLMTARKEFEDNRLERDKVVAELTSLNGGKMVILEDTVYTSPALPSDFKAWYESVEMRNPELQQFEVAMEVNRREVQLGKSQWAPSFTVGYKSERILGTTLQGVGVGVRIPLWQNRYAVKSAEAGSLAIQEDFVDARMKYYGTMQQQFMQAQSLLKLYNEYMGILHAVNTDQLLKKALDAGEMPLIEYIMERNVYHEALHDAFAAERDYHLAVAKLWMYAE